MKRDALRLMRSIYRANKHQNRTEHLETFLDELELLKLEISLCRHEIIADKKASGIKRAFGPLSVHMNKSDLLHPIENAFQGKPGIELADLFTA